MPCTKKGHNKKGSPKRLGKPELGESRHPTAGEREYCGLRGRDLIVVDPSGEIYIMRCVRRGSLARFVLPWRETKIAEMCLEEYWSR